MRVGVLALAVVATSFIAGCGSSKHAAVMRYVQQVNAVSAGMREELGAVAGANRRFAAGTSFSLVRPQLALARRTLKTFAARLDALRPPPGAELLAATLAKLVALEQALTAELYRFTVFLPAFRAAIVSSDRTTAAFRRAARAAKTGTAEARAVDRYAAGLAGPLAALARLRAPALLRPEYSAEVRALRSSRATAIALAAALRSRQRTRAHGLIVRLAQIGVSTGSVDTQRAQIAAVRAYDAEVAQIGRLQTLAQQQVVQLGK